MHKLNYALIGNGRWGKKLLNILKNFNREVIQVNFSRRSSSQSETNYRKKVVEAIYNAPKHLDTAWIAVPPGDQYVLVDVALERGWNVIIEKPLDIKSEKIKLLDRKAKKFSLQIGIHYQYCYLDIFNKLSLDLDFKKYTQFSGKFNVENQNILDIDPLSNLASHLFAIKLLHFPFASIKNIETSYNSPADRSILLQTKIKNYNINFTENSEPLIQRFILDFEKSINLHYLFKLNLNFALLVNKELDHFKKKTKTKNEFKK